MNRIRKFWFPSLILSLSMLGVFSARAEESAKAFEPGEPRKGWSLKEVGGIPVQAGGRVKPLDSLARDQVLLITGRTKFQGWDPVDLLLSWMVFPKSWEEREFILIQRPDVKRQLGLPEDQSRFSPKQLLGDSFLADYAQSMSQGTGVSAQQSTPISKTSRPDPRDQEIRRVVERITAYRLIVTGEAWPVVPQSENKPWAALAVMNHEGQMGEGQPGAPSDGGSAIRKGYMALFTAYLVGDREAFARVGRLTHQEVTRSISGWDSTHEARHGAELTYNRFHPFQWAWIFYLVAALFWAAASWLGKRPGLVRTALALTWIGMLIHTAGIALRCWIAGRPPVTNMYESIIWVSYGILVFASIIYLTQRQTILYAVGTVLGAVALIVADAAPAMIDPSIQPLVAVLRSNYWLTIHVLTITISYAAFALTMGLGNVALWSYVTRKDETEAGAKRVHLLNQLSYRALQFGVVLLAAGTILGGIWADYSWGRFWGWDPKEVWALIALMGYLIVIHARYSGWMRPFGFAAWTVSAFALVLMAWYGVNFVLGAGLHSYGFSTGGQSTVATFLLLQFGYIGLATWRHRPRMKAAAKKSS